MPWVVYPQGKNPQYTYDRRLGGLHSWFGCGCKEIKSLPLPSIKSQ